MNDTDDDVACTSSAWTLEAMLGVARAVRRDLVFANAFELVAESAVRLDQSLLPMVRGSSDTSVSLRFPFTCSSRTLPAEIEKPLLEELALEALVQVSALSTVEARLDELMPLADGLSSIVLLGACGSIPTIANISGTIDDATCGKGNPSTSLTMQLLGMLRPALAVVLAASVKEEAWEE